jgi:dolichol-phosphate mannosyltransferase
MQPSSDRLDRVVVLIPTYNERENLPLIVGRLRTAVPQADVLVLDDGSPDGTGLVADALAAADPTVHVMHRAGKEGLGAAYLAGFQWALDNGYDAAVEMDADGSHQPEQLPRLLEAARRADVVIGSRWTPGGSVVNWPRHRLLLSRGGNTYIKVLLGMKVGDATGGFRVYRRSALETLDLGDVASAGYCFQVDMTWRAAKAGLTIVEVPIEFVERQIGDSKMSQAIVAEAMRNVTVWGVQHRARQVATAVRGRPRLSSLLAREGTWHRL